jgi:hypothetical protein
MYVTDSLSHEIILIFSPPRLIIIITRHPSFEVLLLSTLSIAVAVVHHITSLIISIIIIMSDLTSTRFLSVIGLTLSVYAVYVEYRVEHLSPDEEFTALCDVPALGASCRYVQYEPYFK